MAKSGRSSLSFGKRPPPAAERGPPASKIIDSERNEGRLQQSRRCRSRWRFRPADVLPRVPFALAEQGDFPRAFAAIHRRFHTPYVSILVFAALVWGFALIGEFKWNVTLSAVARLLYYGVGCAALPVLRRKESEGTSALFHLPAGNLLAVLGVILCGVLVTQVDFGQSVILVATVALALVNWAVVAGRRTTA